MILDNNCFICGKKELKYYGVALVEKDRKNNKYCLNCFDKIREGIEGKHNLLLKQIANEEKIEFKNSIEYKRIVREIKFETL